MRLSAKRYKELPRLGIRNFFLNLYNETGKMQEFSNVLLYYSLDNLVKSNLVLQPFPSKELVPGGIRSQGKRFALFVKPLYFQNEQLGFFLSEIGNLDGCVFETLASQLSSALKGAVLVEEIRGYATQLEEKVRQRTLELEEAHTQKTQFFINLAHETKTPLTLIKNYLDKYIRNAGISDDLRIIKRNIDNLLRNMVNFLDVEKLHRGQVFYNHEQSTDLTDLLNNKIILFRAIAGNKRIRITSNIESGIFIKIDPYAADRIINNLMDNAIKYSKEKGTIHVTLKRNRKQITFKVSDTGSGMTKNQQKNIFLPYYQLSHKKRNVQGIGMGLNIVKQIIDSINADITVESSRHVGTTFIIIFPENLVQPEEQIKTNTYYSTPMDIRKVDLRLKEEEIEPDKFTILIIDDNMEMLFFLQSFLKKKYNVFFAGNGREALRKLKHIPMPEIIISDIMMDEMDGYEFYKAISSDINYKDIPFIFLTAKNTIDDKLKGLTSGAIDYIYKPFNIDEITAKIESIIMNRMNHTKKNIGLIENTIKNTIKNAGTIWKMEKTHFNLEDICIKQNLSSRETDVLKLLAKGMRNKEIGNILQISKKTVEFHIHNIYSKFNVQTRIELLNALNKKDNQKGLFYISIQSESIN